MPAANTSWTPISCPWCKGGLCIVLLHPPKGMTYMIDTGYFPGTGRLLCKCCDRTHQRWEEPCSHLPKVAR